MMNKPNTKTQKEIEKDIRNIFYEDMPKEMIPVLESEIIETVDKFANYFTQKLEHLAKQKDEEFLELIGEDESIQQGHPLATPFNAIVLGKNDLRKELRNKLKVEQPEA